MTKIVIKVGQKVKFDPFESLSGFASKDNRGKNAIGTVVFVNKAHKWFLIEHECRRAKIRQAFKFSQIGREVKLCD